MTDRSCKKYGKYATVKPIKQVNKTELFNSRIIQRNLVYVIGLDAVISYEDEILRREEYFGQYGKILKTVVNKEKPFNPRGQYGPTYSAYITFANDREASLAILAVDGFVLHDNVIKASFGTTKYCTYYIREQTCNNSDCLYLHSRANSNDIITRDMYNNRELFKEQHDAVLEHLAKLNSKIGPSKMVQAPKPVLPSVTVAVEKLTEFLSSSKVSPSKTIGGVEISIPLTKWEPEPQEEKTPTLPQLAIGEKSKKDDDDFPTIGQLGISISKKVTSLEDTESSRNQSSEAPKDGVQDSNLPNMSEVDKIILRRLRTTAEEGKGSTIIKEILDGVDSSAVDRFVQLYINKSQEAEALDPPLKQGESSGTHHNEQGQTCIKNADGFKLFKQNYKMTFSNTGSIYSRLDQRLRYKKAKQAGLQNAPQDGRKQQ